MGLLPPQSFGRGSYAPCEASEIESQPVDRWLESGGMSMAVVTPLLEDW